MKKLHSIMLRWGIACAMAMVALMSQAQTFLSPDGKYQFIFSQKDGKLIYRLNYAGKQIVEEGKLGVNIDNHLVESAMGIPVDRSIVWRSTMTTQA